MPGRDGVSFVVPVFNKAEFLPALVATLQGQRGGFPRQYVFVDDGSTDDGLALLRELTAGWEDCVIVSQANAGSAAATNRGIALARYPFIKFVDADDLLHPDCTQRLLAALAPSPAGLVWCERAVFHPGETPETDLPVPEAAPRLREDALRAVLRNALFNPTQILVRTALAREVGGCDERIIHSQEYGLALRLALRAPFLHLPASLAFFCEGVSGSLSAHGGRQLARVTQAQAHFLADHPELPDSLVRFVLCRAAGRALKFRQRHREAGPLLPVLLRQAQARMPWPKPRDPVGFVRACAEAIAKVPLRPGGPPAPLLQQA
jgi:GT2 family glycosyltransferase